MARPIFAYGRLRALRIGVLEAAHFHDLYTEGLEPGEKPVQGGLVAQGAVQDRLDWLH